MQRSVLRGIFVNVLPRLLVVSSHPAQTYADLYRALSRLQSLKIDVLYARNTTDGYFDHEFNRQVAWDIDLTGGYRAHFLKVSRTWVLRVGGLKSGVLRIPSPSMLLETFRTIKALRPDVILLPGHGDPWYLFIWMLCRWKRIPYVLRGTGVMARGTTSFRSRIGRRLATMQVRGSAGFCFIGLENYFFGISHGAKSLIFSPYAIDSNRFSESRIDPSTREQRLREIGLDPALPVVVFSGKLQPWKRPQDVVQAVAKADPALQALVIGDGPMRRELEEMARSLKARVHFAGFINQSEIAGWYALGDVIVLPSGPGGDTWGLALNEALALGLTPIMSDAVPSWPDFAWGEGGVYPVGDVQSLIQEIKKALSRRNDAAHHRALERLRQKYSIEAAARGIETAARNAINSVNGADQ